MQYAMSALTLVIIAVLSYFFIIRPQAKQQTRIKKMLNELKEGDEVMTIGGIYGVIYAVDDENVVLETLPDFSKIMVLKQAVSKVITEEESKIEKEDTEDSEEEKKKEEK